MTEQTAHPSDLALDEHLAGLATERAASAAAHLATCPACAARATALRAGYDAFLAHHPRPERAPAVLSLGRRRVWALGGVFAAAAAALVAVVVVDGPPAPSGVRSKGGSILEIAVGRDGASMPFADQPLRAGDRLAFRYRSTAAHLLLVSLEASGKITVLLPPGGQQSMAIVPGQQQRLADGVELDDYPGTELLLAFFSAVPLATAEVESAIRAAFAALPPDERGQLALPTLPLPAEQLRWLLTKEPR